jgi:hypothetical protein
MIRRAAIVLTLVGLSVLSFSQQPPNREPQAVAVANQSLAAMGAAALARLSNDQLTLVASGTYLQHGADAPASYPFRVKVRGWDKIRWEIDRPDGTVVLLFVGNAGWAIAPDGKILVLANTALAGRQFEKMPFLALAQWVNSPHGTIQHLGTFTGQDISLHRLSLSRPPARARSEQHAALSHRMTRCEVDVDANTFLPVRLRYFEHPGDARLEMPMDLVFTHYQTFQGVQVPTTVTRFLRDQRMDEYRFSSVEFGAAIPDSDFALRGRP